MIISNGIFIVQPLEAQQLPLGARHSRTYLLSADHGKEAGFQILLLTFQSAEETFYLGSLFLALVRRYLIFLTIFVIRQRRFGNMSKKSW
jgi:hypothetical protein